MKLLITETAWGINRVLGGYKERVSAKEVFDCKEYRLPLFGKGKRQFVIEETGENYIRLAVICADERYNKAWIIKKDEDVRYRPRSFDGGYFYDFSLI